jgi:hypothetical protein
MPRKQNTDQALIKSLKEKMRTVDRQRRALESQYNLLNNTLVSLESHDSDKPKEPTKTKRVAGKDTTYARVVDAVVGLSEKKSGPVNITEILADLKEKGINFVGKANVRTRISGILNREVAQNGKARVKRVGRGQYVKA